MAIPTWDQMLHYIQSATRRSFVSRATSGIAAFGCLAACLAQPRRSALGERARRRQESTLCRQNVNPCLSVDILRS
jgi:hypothetical protein